MSVGWPVVLEHGPVRLRPLRLRDAGEWRMTRLMNRDWLEPWEATTPGVTPSDGGRGYADAVRALRRDARLGPHGAACAKWRAKRTPDAARRSRFGVRTTG